MSSLSGVLRQLWRLFVDDGSLAGTLVIWCVGAGSVLPHWITFVARIFGQLFAGYCKDGAQKELLADEMRGDASEYLQ